MIRRLLTAAAVLAAAAVAHAALPTFWQVSTEAEFLQGDVENLAVDSYGRLTLGPATDTVYESSAPFLWTMISAPDGAVFVGSGNEGQIHRIDATGRATLFFDAEELEVHAIVAAPGGGIYVATSPEGKVYRVNANGSSSVFFDPPDKYVWSLAVDPAGNVFVGTGDKGIVYKVTADGKGTPFYETKASHVMALAFDRSGRLLAGTESPGRIFQIDATGKPFVLQNWLAEVAYYGMYRLGGPSLTVFLNALMVLLAFLTMYLLCLRAASRPYVAVAVSVYPFPAWSMLMPFWSPRLPDDEKPFSPPKPAPAGTLTPEMAASPASRMSRSRCAPITAAPPSPGASRAARLWRWPPCDWPRPAC